MTEPLAVELIADGRANGGAYVVLDVRAPAGTELPPHVASREDAAILVIAGELGAVLPDETRTYAAGEVLCLPRGAPRRLWARTDVHVVALARPASARLIDLVSPPAPSPDDLAVLLLAAGVDVLPATWGSAAR